MNGLDKFRVFRLFLRRAPSGVRICFEIRICVNTMLSDVSVPVSFTDQSPSLTSLVGSETFWPKVLLEVLFWQHF